MATPSVRRAPCARKPLLDLNESPGALARVFGLDFVVVPSDVALLILAAAAFVLTAAVSFGPTVFLALGYGS